MKKLSIYAIFNFMLMVFAQAQTITRYDSTLAKQVGADDYGMKQYVLAILKRGPNREQDSIRRAEMQQLHMANINRMAQEGSLLLAGPFLEDGDLRGIYIFNVTTVEEAKALTQTDPLIKSGGLVMELHPWYGSAALMLLNKQHQQVAKTKF
ncbi:MAG: hypothetical protein IPO27_18330 [Bacteroidetes bacterium]|nr:hypothetical protein [Bacteroidota bacterium]